MPLYDFECQSCGHRFEVFGSINHPRHRITCPGCKGWSKRIIVQGHGGFKSENPNWLDDNVRGALQDDDEVRAGREKRIENRTDYNRHLKENGIVERR